MKRTAKGRGLCVLALFSTLPHLALSAPAPAVPCGTGCDIVVALDESSSIPTSQFPQMTGFASSVVNGLQNRGQLGTATEQFQVGVVTFSDRADLDVPISGNPSIVSSINALPQAGGGTNTAEAIQVSRNALINGRGSCMWNIVVTDGQSSDAGATQSEAQVSQGQGIRMISIGIGTGVDPSELQGISTPSATQTNTFLVNTFSELVQIATNVVACVSTGVSFSVSISSAGSASGSAVAQSFTAQFAALGQALTGNGASGANGGVSFSLTAPTATTIGRGGATASGNIAWSVLDGRWTCTPGFSGANTTLACNLNAGVSIPAGTALAIPVSVQLTPQGGNTGSLSLSAHDVTLTGLNGGATSSVPFQLIAPNAQVVPSTPPAAPLPIPITNPSPIALPSPIPVLLPTPPIPFPVPAQPIPFPVPAPPVLGPVPTATPTPTRSGSQTPSLTRSSSASATPSPSATGTLSLTRSGSTTPSPTPSPTPSSSHSTTGTDSATITGNFTATPTLSPTRSPTRTPDHTWTDSSTRTWTPSETPTRSRSPTTTSTLSPTRSPTATQSQTATPSASGSGTTTPSASPSPTGTAKPTRTRLTETPRRLAVCNNGVAEPGEVCDRTDVRGLNCSSLGFATSGSVRCSADCENLILSECTATCGNNMIDSGEQCDGTSLGSETCGSLGRQGGILSCNSNCRYDVSRCSTVQTCRTCVPGSDLECSSPVTSGISCNSVAVDSNNNTQSINGTCVGGTCLSFASCLVSADCGNPGICQTRYDCVSGRCIPRLSPNFEPCTPPGLTNPGQHVCYHTLCIPLAVALSSVTSDRTTNFTKIFPPLQTGAPTSSAARDIEADDDDDSSNAAAWIIGALIGLLLCSCLGAVLWWCMRRPEEKVIVAAAKVNPLDPTPADEYYEYDEYENFHPTPVVGVIDTPFKEEVWEEVAPPPPLPPAPIPVPVPVPVPVPMGPPSPTFSPPPSPPPPPMSPMPNYYPTVLSPMVEMGPPLEEEFFHYPQGPMAGPPPVDNTFRFPGPQATGFGPPEISPPSPLHFAPPSSFPVPQSPRFTSASPVPFTSIMSVGSRPSSPIGVPEGMPLSALGLAPQNETFAPQLLSSPRIAPGSPTGSPSFGGGGGEFGGTLPPSFLATHHPPGADIMASRAGSPLPYGAYGFSPTR